MGSDQDRKISVSLAINRKVAVSTQNQAFNAILFLYRDVLLMPVADRIEAVRSRKAKRLPTVLGKEEVGCLLHAMEGGGPSTDGQTLIWKRAPSHGGGAA